MSPYMAGYRDGFNNTSGGLPDHRDPEHEAKLREQYYAGFRSGERDREELRYLD